jgi:hypothetical protein
LVGPTSNQTGGPDGRTSRPDGFNEHRLVEERPTSSCPSLRANSPPIMVDNAAPAERSGAFLSMDGNLTFQGESEGNDQSKDEKVNNFIRSEFVAGRERHKSDLTSVLGQESAYRLDDAPSGS